MLLWLSARAVHFRDVPLFSVPGCFIATAVGERACVEMYVVPPGVIPEEDQNLTTRALIYAHN